MTRILISGAAGFLGSHLVTYLLEKTDWEIVSLDRYDTSGNINRLAEIIGDDEEKKKRLTVVYHDLKAPLNEFTDAAIGDIDYVVHMAASSHVDRSITDPLSFVMDNVVGTTNLLNWARQRDFADWRSSGKTGSIKKIINFSTDETMGPAPIGYAHTEDDPHKPSNPYAASKAGQEDIGYSFNITYGLPVITTRTMNNFGQRQHPEKLVPRTIRSIMNGTPMPIFAELDANGELKAVGSRYWLHAQNTADAVFFLLSEGNPGETYNVIGFDELTNLEMAERIASIIGKPLIPEFVDFHATRPGHDRRYALDGDKMRAMGWKPILSFEDGLKQTVEWTMSHSQWM